MSLLLALPWLLLMTAFLLAVRLPRELPAAGEARTLLPDPAPLVSVVIPARNEAHNIVRVIRTVTSSTYPRFEVVVVDDESQDGTGTAARALPRGHAERLEIITGKPLPAGWLGKPWSCAQGAKRARGALLLFTDADTVHEPDLLLRSVAGLEQDSADALTVFGRQIMGSFWERLVMPHVFGMLMARFPMGQSALGPERWRDAIANGQFVLLRRSVYQDLGTHEVVKDEVVEDLRLAQLLVRGGWRLTMRRAEEALGTRMYRGLGELVRGWTKNVSLGAQQTFPAWVRPVLMPASVAGLVAFWLAPPLAFLSALAGLGGAGLLTWSSVVVAGSGLFWSTLGGRMGAPRWMGLIYPVGAAVGTWIVLRSWLRGTRVEWKGREYQVREPE